MNAIIRSVGAYVPKKRMSNDDVAKMVDTSDEWILSHTGIKNRHIAAEDEATSDLAYKAADVALKRADLTSADIDLILVATCTPDYVGFPSTACIVQDKLKAHHAGCLDISAACTGFIYGLEIAKNFVLTGAGKNILVIGAELLSRTVDWSDRNTCVLFGDGAGAAVITTGNAKSNGIINSVLQAEGQGADLLKRPVGGTRTPFIEGKHKESDLMTKMAGQEVYHFAIRVIIATIKKLLNVNGLTMDDLAYIIPHQANIRIIQAACKRAKLPLDKFYLNIDEYANTSAASIPIALNEMHEKKMLKTGDLVLTVGFGGGLTYGGNLIQWA
ncbi:MAG: ketoacyl-ACP synthase III [Spirochaetales bacterium]|nr:ketoacyl-ACP synthase III [Spirochaetales bacterium]